MCEPVTLGLIAGAATSFGAVGAGATVAGVAGATATTAGLTALQAIALGASVGGTVMSAGSAYQQSQANKQIAQNNATVAEYQAQDAQRRGEDDAQAVQRRVWRSKDHSSLTSALALKPPVTNMRSWSATQAAKLP